jgi:replicative DNA helicase
MPEQYTRASDFIDADLEWAVMAAIAQRPDVYWEVVDLLPPAALTATREVYGRLAQAVEQRQALPTIDREPAPDPLAAARELANLYQKRLLGDLVQGLQEGLRRDPSAPALILRAEEQLTRLQQAVRDLQVGRAVRPAELFPDLLRDIAAQREAFKNKKRQVPGIPTGLPRWDKLLGGLQPGVHILSGEPGQGKTACSLQLTNTAAQADYPVLYVSFEEPLQRLLLKLVCTRALLNAKRMAEGFEDPAKLEQAFARFSPQFRRVRLLEGTSRLTCGRVKAEARQAMNQEGATRCLILVDYLQCWAATRRDRQDFRHVVSGLVGELRELALRLDSPVVLISSQNRQSEGSAKLVSLKESGDLEYAADTVAFLVQTTERWETPPARAVDLVVEKNRFGDKGRVPLVYRPDLGTFREESNA